MDERLKLALESANMMVTFNNQSNLLKQGYKESCLYHQDGHRFTVNRELINFLSTLVQRGLTEDVVVMDDSETPFMITDVSSFLDKLFDIYVESSNEYYHNYTKLKSSRALPKVLGI
jgi:hypothetical protein